MATTGAEAGAGGAATATTTATAVGTAVGTAAAAAAPPTRKVQYHTLQVARESFFLDTRYVVGVFSWMVGRVGGGKGGRGEGG